MTGVEDNSCTYLENIKRNDVELVCQGSENRNLQDSQNNNIVRIFLNAVIHALDFLLLAILSPFFIWQWLSRHDHVMIMLRIIIEVILEWLMWTIFAGVSIISTAALLLEDWFASQSNTNKSLINKKSGRCQKMIIQARD